MWEALLTTRVFWTAVVVFRLWNALFVRTFFNPDEYWQSTEVAHRLVFGYGYLCVSQYFTVTYFDRLRLRIRLHDMFFYFCSWMS